MACVRAANCPRAGGHRVSRAGNRRGLRPVAGAQISQALSGLQCAPALAPPALLFPSASMPGVHGAIVVRCVHVGAGFHRPFLEHSLSLSLPPPHSLSTHTNSTWKEEEAEESWAARSAAAHLYLRTHSLITLPPTHQDVHTAAHTQRCAHIHHRSTDFRVYIHIYALRY